MNLLVIIVCLIQQIYERTEEETNLAPYTQLLMNYFVSKTYIASNYEKNKSN